MEAEGKKEPMKGIQVLTTKTISVMDLSKLKRDLFITFVFGNDEEVTRGIISEVSEQYLTVATSDDEVDIDVDDLEQGHCRIIDIF